MIARIVLVIISLVWYPYLTKPWKNEKKLGIIIIFTILMAILGSCVFYATTLFIGFLVDFIIHGF